MNLLKILQDTDYTYNIDYGNPLGRIESYEIDQEHYYGYDSSGNYVHRPISKLNHEYIQRIYQCKVIYSRQ